MGFKCGIIGLPNVGKSTLFNALTKSSIAASNFPFCTIKPNIGVVQMIDLRLDKLAEIVKPKHVLPTTMEFIDIAGLVKNASKGAGLGNKFLNNIRATEAIVHVVRCFENNNIIHVNNKVDPVEDIEVINVELALSDLDICERAIHRIQKKVKSGDKEAKIEMSALEKCFQHLKNSRMLRTLNLNIQEKAALNYLSFLTLKPIMYIANINEDNRGNNPHLNKVFSIAKSEGSIAIALCAVFESDLSELENEEHAQIMANFSLKETGLIRVIRTGYDLLKLQTYFTAGIKEVRAWTIPAGATAKKAAGKIHTDFEKGFIRAQTIAYEDFITYKGEQGAKEAGKMRLEGKNYIVKDGDIMNFLFNI